MCTRNESLFRSVLYANLGQMKRLKCRIFLSQRILEIAKEMADACTPTKQQRYAHMCVRILGCVVSPSVALCCPILSACSSTILQYVLWLHKMESRMQNVKPYFIFFTVFTLFTQAKRTRIVNDLQSHSFICVHFVSNRLLCFCLSSLSPSGHVSFASYSFTCE